MATKKLLDYLKTTMPGSGDFTLAKTTPQILPNTYVSPGSIRTAAAPAPLQTPPEALIRTPSPVAPVPPTSPAAPLFQNPSAAPVGPQGSTGAAPAAQVPQQYLRADGTIKSPDEVAADIASTLKAAHGHGDVPNLALQQFANKDQSVEDLSADARRIGNARNDLAVGETDPYKVASESGIAYSPAELSAIEKAYAGIYDPALDTALAKVQSKQDSDKAVAAAKAQADQPFTLSKDQVRYDGQGNPIAVGIPSDGGSSGTYVKGQNPTIDAYVEGSRNGTYKPSDIPDEYKGIVAQGVAATKPKTSKSSNDAISVINEISASPILDRLSGFSLNHPSSLFPGTDIQPVMNLTKQLKGLLSLENRTQLKGSGAISDFEFRVLGEAASALGIDDNGRTNLKPEDFKAQLNKLKLKLQVGETNLADDELLYLQSKGYTPDQIKEYDDQAAFSDVGNTIASISSEKKGNIPQRNNNPGNVKSGGLADALATGTDKYGHLIFPDAATGFKALTADITAKINKGTARLPVNPTIAQLGKVYAEDPNWPIKVAQILGVPVDTHTQAVPLANLVKAIATQEGFYA